MYDTRMASVLSGATVAQLRFWRKPGPAGPLLLPSGSEPGQRARYSYEDVVALRMFVRLRQATSLQRIRRAVAHLRAKHPASHLSAHRLKAEPTGRTIVWLSPDGDYIDVVERPGQPGFPVVMEEVFRAFRTGDGRRVPDLAEPTKGLAVDDAVRSGYPVLAGTRVPYDAVASLAADGLTDGEILALYPSATPIGIKGAVEFAGLVAGAEASPIPAA
ncbi:MAG: DUF433 domain-containing protein [Dermatophilaceae bacterium]